ncbi:efflux RND transporter periplasmic adaptor subunit [Olivibacter sitiensis]|uniref:efflux RND transporter periplasmic adaptor subunit n=1 Tax=Olivibacter sitiensis TaxID=376470 RepID=UPI0004222563|nr:efflux RND transporter periplasmic adaptor subunit [Olivibacter sitiensis]
MNRKKFIIQSTYLLLGTVLASCQNDKKEDATTSARKYTCPMHPQIVRDAPGTCPICGMDLVPFEKGTPDKTLTLSRNQQALANISIVTVGSGQVMGYKRLSGRLRSNPEHIKYISSRNTGRIEKLYTKEVGRQISKGSVLYQIYSEDLLVLQNDLLMTYKQASALQNDERFRQVYLAARQKLLHYGQSEKQIDQVLQQDTVHPYTTYYSPISGTISKIEISEGQYVEEGTALMEIENYASLWVEADIYPHELSTVKGKKQLTVELPDGQVQQVMAEFVDPALADNAQTIRIRGRIDNSQQLWQAGMMVNVLLPTSSAIEALTIPTNAVIRDGERSIIWTALEDSKFEPREVQLGLDNGDQVEVRSGLTEGEKIVATGAYLLYSEYILKKGSDI